MTTKRKDRFPPDEAALNLLLNAGYIPVKNHPDYIINPEGKVFRVTAPPTGPIHRYPRRLFPVNFGRKVGPPCEGYKLVAPPPWKGIRCVTIRTLLKENFPESANAAPLP